MLLPERFAAVAARFPDAVAVDVPGGERLTYAHLARRADAVAAALAPKVGPETVVALLLTRESAWLYAAQLGVLKAGAAYVALDPVFPDERLSQIVADAAPVALLVDAAGAARWPDARALRVETLPEPESPPPIAPWLDPDSLAYLIYTSGTTGAPKGVEIAHRSVASLVDSDIAAFGLGPGDRVAQGSSPAYDSSVEELWLALAVGATVVPMDDAAARLGPDLVDWLRRERITVLCPPPTLLRSMGCADPRAALPDLRLLYVGGEALTPDVADAWAPGRRLVNGYGPTECTVTAVRCDVRAGEPVGIGWPVDGLSAHVLDESLEPVAEGEPGELCLGGIGLARGYRNQPERTAEKFVEHPRFGRLYRTGDRVRRGDGGCLFYLGRIDAQVKLRGYRIELEAIETALAGLPGVREAACRVQSDGVRDDLIACIVPTDPAAPPAVDSLKAALARSLPPYMVPSRIGFVDGLPKSVGGKLRRESLPWVAASAGGGRAPETAQEVAVAAAFAAVLGLESVSVDDDFFLALGGSSLLAAQLVSRLRENPATAAVTVRDVYEAPTVAGLAVRVRPLASPPAPVESNAGGRPALATAIQALWLLLELCVGSAVGAAGVLWLLPDLLEGFGVVGLLLGWPLAAALLLALWAPLSVGLAAAGKRLLLGAYRPGDAPVWGSFYVRHWILLRLARAIPWTLFEGTELTSWALRALGATVGRRVHFHRGAVPRDGGWDLLALGDDVTLAQEAALRLVELEGGCLVMGRVSLGDGATLGVRASVGPGASLGAGASLTALSSLPAGASVPAGERWDGIPARPASRTPEPPPLEQAPLSPVAYAVRLIAARGLLGVALALPLEGLLWWASVRFALDAGRVVHLLHGAERLRAPLVLAGLASAALPLTLGLEALASRALGRAEAGVVPLCSAAHLRVWLKTGLVASAGRWLSGTLFWPVWLRAAGMRVGPDCEVSTILDTVPELTTLEGETFFADGIYLGSPEIHRGTVRLGEVHLSRGSFVGNHAVIPPGTRLPPDILLGVCTVADASRIHSGSSWFGLPPFELPRREIVAADRRLTHAPTPIRYANRLFWEGLRFVLPAAPALGGLAWTQAVGAGLAAPVATLALGGTSAALLLALKWGLLGRVRPGTHALWSCWCSRWDFLYVAWGEWARPFLAPLEGTLLLNAYLRLVGMKIGRRVVLSGGFSQVVDPDMIEIGDGATVSAMFQAHTFEDRVLKIDRVVIEAGASVGAATVPLYGARIGAGCRVAAHSVVMKREVLLPGVRYEGAPSRPVTR